MKTLFLQRLVLKSALLAVLWLPSLAAAQYFTDTQAGDVDAGFRKTGAFQEPYEMVVYLGNISNFLAMAPGTQTNITFFSSQLSDMCANGDGFGNLQWSVFAAFNGTISNSSGVWPRSSCLYTVARTNVAAQTQPINRLSTGTANSLHTVILSVSTGANTSSSQLGQTNADNNTRLVLEPVDFNTANNLTTYIGDPTDPANGDFSGYLTFSVENTTPGSFTSPAVSDFYANVPAGTFFGNPIIDPLTGSASGVADYLGYFTLNPNGTLTFTRASLTPPAPVASFSGTPTSGFAPLQVTFTDTSTGTITNWVWSFGDGQSVTNTSNVSVNHTFATAGNYSVTLTVNGPGGSNDKVQSSYVAASPAPTLSNATLSGGNLVFSGSNCPAGVQYRILTSTNVALPLGSWKPVTTNMFLSNGTFSYTNSPAGNQTAFFRLVSP